MMPCLAAVSTKALDRRKHALVDHVRARVLADHARPRRPEARAHEVDTALLHLVEVRVPGHRVRLEDEVAMGVRRHVRGADDGGRPLPSFVIQSRPTPSFGPVNREERRVLDPESSACGAARDRSRDRRPPDGDRESRASTVTVPLLGRVARRRSGPWVEDGQREGAAGRDVDLSATRRPRPTRAAGSRAQKSPAPSSARFEHALDGGRIVRLVRRGEEPARACARSVDVIDPKQRAPRGSGSRRGRSRATAPPRRDERRTRARSGSPSSSTRGVG